MMKSSGRLITLEGGEGSGKSTQSYKIQEFLWTQNLDVLVTREPGGSEGAELIRQLLVQGQIGTCDPMSEYLLFSAARRDHLIKTVWPALEKGQWVICDRFYDSSRAYQGAGHFLDTTFMDQVYHTVANSLQPDLTFIFDIDPELGLNRALSRQNREDRYEHFNLDFHQRIRQAYLDIAEREPNRCHVIQAQHSVENVYQNIIDVLTYRFFSK